MGTPEFAVPCLDILVENGYNVVAVITSPDKPAGRGLQLAHSPVKAAALTHNIPVLQPEKLKDPAFLETLRSYEADLQIVVAFRMLPEAVWNMPRLGTFNLHASLLPQYRGAAPINWAIINGETQTGITTFFLQHEIDTGDIILKETENILPTDNVGTLYERLMHKGAGLVLRTVQAIEANAVQPTPQVFDAPLKAAPKIFKETCRINFEQTAEQIHNFVRGLSPYPAAWTLLNGKSCKVFKTNLVDTDVNAAVGQLFTDHKTFLHVGTAKGLLAIEELQTEGKKRMNIAEFLRGNKIAEGTVME
ncbi:methionyl-tRNA formyltransferase [Flexibacter flexilis DSM 6793]|uniref:Methionyl-tRNA formyltransferase n=2 Tax=Flexibacter flexilis TaxID=998 RepID=A0A1I1LS04_9BACT|nr:methionyl-tRNA formyltransferase [Flexibacter flexilis DSM 6793]